MKISYSNSVTLSLSLALSHRPLGVVFCPNMTYTLDRREIETEGDRQENKLVPQFSEVLTVPANRELMWKDRTMLWTIPSS